MRRVPALLAGIMLLGLARTEAAPATNTVVVIPKRFTATIGGFLGHTYRLELDGNALNYILYDAGRRNPRTNTLHPTLEEWREFRSSLDSLNVWQWQREYRNASVMDGTQWELDINYGERAVTSRGSNSYPDQAGKPGPSPQPTKTFVAYLTALKKLCGGKAFE